MSKKMLFSLGGGLSGVKYGASLSLTIDDEYVISAQLLDQNGDPLGEAQTIDLPLESVVVDGSYDAENKALVLTLDNGNTISIPVADLINGLQAEITPDNKLSADLVDDSSSENKFVTQEEKNEIARSAELNLENGTGIGSIKLTDNTVSGQKSTGLGHNNVVQADRAFASGGGNIIRYDGQTQNGYMGFASGQNNYVSGWSASAIGEQLEAKYGGQLVVGEANANKSDTLFEVGNGTTAFAPVSSKPTWQEIINNPIYYIRSGSGAYTKITGNNYTETQYANLFANEIYIFDDTGRSNAFEVSEDGVARAYGTPIANNDLIPKGYADIHYGQNVKTITVASSQIVGAGNDVYTTAQFIRFTPTQEQATILANNDYTIIKLDLTALGSSAPAPYVWLRRNTTVSISGNTAYQFTCGGEQFWYENYPTDIAIKNIGNAALVYVPELILSPQSTPYGVADITLLNISIPTLYESIGNKVDNTTTIAGIDLQDNITKQELANALGVSPDLNIENGAGDYSLVQKEVRGKQGEITSVGRGSAIFGGFRGDKPDNTPTAIPNDDASVNNMSQDEYNDTISKVAGIQSYIFGAGNRAYGDWNFIMGKDSKTCSRAAYVFGGKCYVGDTSNPNLYLYSMAIGSANSITTPYSLASGHNNSISIHGDASAVIGLNNILQASYSLLVGKGNSITNNGNDTFSSAAIGEGNTLNTSYGYALGRKNQIRNPYSVAIGESNIIVSDFSTTIGRGLITREAGQIVLGKFNEDKISNCLLVLGNGADGSHRSNAFEVTDTGIARAYGSPEGNYDLTNKSYVDTKVDTKVSKTDSVSQVYGTDSNGAPTTYNISDLGTQTLTGNSTPTTSTPGVLGQIYIDTTNKIPYMCVDIDNGTYMWVAIAAVSLDYSSTN